MQGKIAYVGRQKHTLCKVWYLVCSLSLWKSNVRLQSGKIWFLWRSDPAEFQVPRAQGRVSLKPARTEVSLLCSMGLTACGTGPIDSMCRCTVWNKSGLTLYVPGIPVACLMSLFLFAFISFYSVFTDFTYINKKEHQRQNSIMTTLTMVDNLHSLFPCSFATLLSLKLRFSESFVKSH